MKESIALDGVIAYLNDLLATDRPAVAALVANRVPCNQVMANHPTAQVMSQHGGYHIGLLGVINGMFGTLNGTDGPIAVVFENGTLLRFARRDDYPY